jgi:hypothetical protein
MVNKETSNEKLTFQEELEVLINKFSKENESNTPDFILAKYLDDCLDAYNSAVKRRDELRSTCIEENNLQL